MKTLLVIASLLLAGCALPQRAKPVEPKADKIEACIGRIADVSGANIEQAFEVCRQLHRLRKVE